MFQFKTVKIIFIVFLSCLLFISNSYAKDTYRVKSTDSLSRIAAKFYKGSELSRHQLFIGILAENPDAFRLGNINNLKKGATLNLPDSSSILAMEPKDAARLVSEHNQSANKKSKTRLKPPFKDYIPKSSSNISSEIKLIAEKQQEASNKLQQLDSESENLQFRLQQLEADKKAMDEELEILENLIKQ